MTKVLDLIRLQSRAGEIIGDFEIPMFQERPNVVIWGDRVFHYIGDGYYVEAFSVHIVTEMRDPQSGESPVQHKHRINSAPVTE